MRHFFIILLMTTGLQARAEQAIDQTLAVSADGEVIIEVVSGEVDIEGWDKSEVRVTGELSSDKRTFRFDTKSGKTTIEVDHDGGGWGKHGHGDSAELTVYVPAGSSVETDGKSTDFNVNGVRGGVDINTISGDIVAKNLSQNIDLESVSGDISIRDSKGKINLESVSGDVDANVEAHEFDAHSISGDVEASIGNSKRVRIGSVSGEVELELSLDDKGRIDAETVSGDVDIVFKNKVVNARFDLETGPGGEIDNNLTKDRPDESFLGSGSLSFKSGNGGGSVQVDTMSGTIEVSN